jgi:hypothetical protein
MAKKQAAKPKKKVKKKVKKARKARRVPGSAARSAPLVTMAAAGGGIDLITAGEIVQNAIPGGPHDIDSTLEDAGLISPGQRTVFRSDVVNDVAAHGATIAAADVPNSSTTTLRQARTAVQQNAH